MSKIRLIIPYYGSWPVYLQVFLSSLERNKMLRLALITDLPPPERLPGNCDFVKLSFEGLKERVRQAVDPAASLCTPYKLCDYKPVYADLFPELTRGFSFWAFGDIDLVYGDISASLPCNWEEHDILTFRREWVSGAFTILRNSSKVNKLYRQSSSFPSCLQATGYAGFDECFQLFDLLIGKGSDAILALDASCSFSSLVRQASRNGALSVYQETRIKESIARGDCVFSDCRGLTDVSGTSYLLYHYITEKKTVYFRLPCWTTLPSTFRIDRYGFYRSDLPCPRLLLRRFSCQLRGLLHFLVRLTVRLTEKLTMAQAATK